MPKELSSLYLAGKAANNQHKAEHERKKQARRVYSRLLRFEARERLIDLGMIAFPVFTIVGLIMISARFWFWLLF